jgi:hypothetical protein
MCLKSFVYFIIEFEAGKVCWKNQRKHSADATETTGIVNSPSHYKVKTEKRKHAQGTWIDHQRPALMLINKEINFCYRRLHQPLIMSVDLAKLEQHLATRSYVEG